MGEFTTGKSIFMKSCWILQHYLKKKNIFGYFLSNQKKIGGNLPRSFFSQSQRIKILRQPFCSAQSKTIITMSLGMTYHIYVFGEGLQVTNFDQCLHTVMVIGKCTDIFRGIFLVWVWGSGEGAIQEDLSLEEYFLGEEKFNENGALFSSITIKKKQQ